jgi:phage terminase Nu1 subunit (DNA packaging protein)
MAPSVAKLAVVFGVSPTTVKNWQAEGLPRHESGGFHLPTVINWRIQREIERAAAGKRSRTLEASDSPDVEREKLMKLRAERQLKELEFAVASDAWVRVEDVQQAFAERARLIADGLEALSAKHPKVADDVRLLRESYSRGEITKQVIEMRRLGKRGGTIARGRGRPRKGAK